VHKRTQFFATIGAFPELQTGYAKITFVARASFRTPLGELHRPLAGFKERLYGREGDGRHTKGREGEDG